MTRRHAFVTNTRPYYHTFEKQHGTRVWLKGREMVMLASNDYLGFPVTEASSRPARRGSKPGVQSDRSAPFERLPSYHVELRGAHGRLPREGGVSCPRAGYLSCMSAIQPFAQKDDLILADKNCTLRSGGIGLTQARVERFAHNNPRD